MENHQMIWLWKAHISGLRHGDERMHVNVCAKNCYFWQLSRPSSKSLPTLKCISLTLFWHAFSNLCKPLHHLSPHLLFWKPYYFLSWNLDVSWHMYQYSELTVLCIKNLVHGFYRCRLSRLVLVLCMQVDVRILKKLLVESILFVCGCFSILNLCICTNECYTSHVSVHGPWNCCLSSVARNF